MMTADKLAAMVEAADSDVFALHDLYAYLGGNADAIVDAMRALERIKSAVRLGPNTDVAAWRNLAEAMHSEAASALAKFGDK